MDVGDKVKLEPCPFCAGQDMAVHEHFTGSSYMVLCHYCTAEGPLEKTWEAAAAKWNRRTPSASIGEDGLPELPFAPVRVESDDDSTWGQIQDDAWALDWAHGLSLGAPLFTADQMRQYARDYAEIAVSADRLERAAPTNALVAMANRLRVKRDAEIAYLRAQLARRSQGEPFGYYVVESNEMPYAGSGFVKKPVDGIKYSNVTALYAAPPLSSEPQAEKGAAA